jgi:hypothetical protein
LLLPDSKSRTPTEDGRRIIPLSDGRDWGWCVVNYAHYRQLKREEDRREYHRNYWNEKRSIKTDSTSLNTLNTTQHTQPNQPIAYAEAKAKAEAINTIIKPDGFDVFYKAYPRKVGKQAASKAFTKAKAHAILADILADIDRRVSNGEWTSEKAQYIPYPATYLNGKRWEDEQDAANSGTVVGILPGAI